MSTRFTTTARIALLASSALLLPQAAFAQDAAGTEDQVGEQPDAAAPASEIVVTGFRESLNAAIAAKRESVGQIDVIVAEDIAKFPDTNLAESLQRIPGVALDRHAGNTLQGIRPDWCRGTWRCPRPR